MPGPQPKDPSTRARRNKTSTRSTLSGPLPAEQRPALPESRVWNPMTVSWWEDLWAAPMSSEYHASDRHGLFVLAALMDEFWLNPTTGLAAEIRQQRAAFGLTPMDRRRLEWTIESAEDAKDRGAQRRGRSIPAAGSQPAPDPRSLYVVS